jgi:2-methylcitrate dehydratase PrpD
MGKKYDIKSEDIEQIYISGLGAGGLVGDPFEIKEKPQVDAQFCAAYGVALGILRKDASVFRYTDEAILNDNEVCELAKRVEYISDDTLPPYAEAPENWPPYVGRHHMVTVKTKDGKKYQEYRTSWDVLSNESTYEDVTKKLHECASFSGICSEERAAEIAEKIKGLDNSEDISFLTGKMI